VRAENIQQEVAFRASAANCRLTVDSRVIAGMTGAPCPEAYCAEFQHQVLALRDVPRREQTKPATEIFVNSICSGDRFILTSLRSARRADIVPVSSPSYWHIGETTILF
jgi:hypothetical protein